MTAMPICARCGQGFDTEVRACPRCGLPAGAAWAGSQAWFPWLCLTVGQLVAFVLSAATLIAAVISLVRLRSYLPLLRAFGVDAEGAWLALGIVAEGAVGFFFWAGLFIVFSKAKQMPEV
jgi:hypothetical protein